MPSAAIEGPLITQADIEAGLTEVGVSAGDILLVHTSLKAFGWVCGGSVAVINALKAIVTDKGVIVMPSFAELSDPKHWINPPVLEDWWPRIRETMPAYDSARTPTIGLGRTPEVFRSDPDVERSQHPRLSFASWGARAPSLIADHELESGLGDGSPLKALYDADAKILFLGTGFGTCTAFHLGEWRARARPMVDEGAPMMVNGERQWISYQDMDYEEDPFGEIGDAFEKEHAVAKTKVGWADVRLFSLRDAVDFAEQALKKAVS